jgi:hypothetical protein
MAFQSLRHFKAIEKSRRQLAPSLRPPVALPQVTFHQPIAPIAWMSGTTKGYARGDALKIYMLMLLIGTIAAMSHLNPQSNSAKRKA